MAKYGHIAEQNRFQFIPTIFSHTGQIHAAFKDLLGEQIRHKIIAFEGHAKSSRINSAMKWWSRCISMVIAKTASRNVAFKAARLGDSIFDLCFNVEIERQRTMIIIHGSAVCR